MLSSMRALGAARHVRLQGVRRLPAALAARPLCSRTVTSAHKEGGFNELRERSMLRYVISESTEGSPETITAAMDTFWDTHFNGEGTAEWQLRSAALEQAISLKAPKTILEIGTYCGYSAVLMGKLLPPGGRLVSIEIDPLYAAISTKARRPPPTLARRARHPPARARRAPDAPRAPPRRSSSTRGWAIGSSSRSAPSPSACPPSRRSTA
jgi:hypothetical protein